MHFKWRCVPWLHWVMCINNWLESGSGRVEVRHCRGRLAGVVVKRENKWIWKQTLTQPGNSLRSERRCGRKGWRWGWLGKSGGADERQDTEQLQTWAVSVRSPSFDPRNGLWGSTSSVIVGCERGWSRGQRELMVLVNLPPYIFAQAPQIYGGTSQLLRTQEAPFPIIIKWRW